MIPEVFEPYVSASVLGRARARGVFSFYAHDLRKWTSDPHHTVDDTVYGGGPGMLMKVEPIARAVTDRRASYEGPSKVIFFAPWGKPFKEADAVRLSKEDCLIMVCGRYEGIDERAYALADEVFSFGDFVTTGAELACLQLTDATVRRLPGALGDDTSAVDESFSSGLLEYAQYTHPEVILNKKVPSVLLSGNHAAIASWRRKSALIRTLRYRPEMLLSAELSSADQAFLQQAAEHFNVALPTPAAKGALSPAERKKRRRAIAKSTLRVACFVGAAFLLSLVIRAFVVEPYVVPSGSMEQTILKGDHFFGEKVSYYFRNPEQGEIATFIDPEDPNSTLVKRVIAVPGQTVDVKNGSVYIDGKVLNEPYTKGKPTLPQVISFPYTLGQDEYWMMGDNRTNSKDSRTFGPIKRSAFTSHAWAIFWPFNRAEIFENPDK